MNDPKLIEACKRVIESVGELWKTYNNIHAYTGQQNAWEALKHNAEVLGSLIDIVGYNKEPEDRPYWWLRCDKCLAWNGTGCEHWLNSMRGAYGMCMFWHCKDCRQPIATCCHNTTTTGVNPVGLAVQALGNPEHK